MHLRISHTIGYEYNAPVAASYNETRLVPLTRDGQLVTQTRLDVLPRAWMFGYRDYWGSQVTAFEVLEPHTALTVVGTSTVHTAPPIRAAFEGMTWAQIESVAGEFPEYLAVLERAQPPEDLLAEIQVFRELPTPTDAARAICRFIHENVAYRPGSTVVDTVAADAWAQRSGVCQDITHLALGCVRSLGIPSRYVSGYLHPNLDPKVGVTVEGESHAWIEWWDNGWQGFDPTNLTDPTDRHIVVATGRSYDDVRPIAGIYSGTAKPSKMFVKVEITRLP